MAAHVSCSHDGLGQASGCPIDQELLVASKLYHSPPPLPLQPTVKSRGRGRGQNWAMEVVLQTLAWGVYTLECCRGTPVAPPLLRSPFPVDTRILGLSLGCVILGDAFGQERLSAQPLSLGRSCLRRGEASVLNVASNSGSKGRMQARFHFAGPHRSRSVSPLQSGWEVAGIFL